MNFLKMDKSKNYSSVSKKISILKLANNIKTLYDVSVKTSNIPLEHPVKM